MIHVGVENLKPGLILERPVKNSQGILLLEAGARITRKNIRTFKSWGVTDVTIKGEAVSDGDSAGNPAVRLMESVDKQLQDKFSEVLDDPVMVEIYKAAMKQLDQNDNSDESPDEQS